LRVPKRIKKRETQGGEEGLEMKKVSEEFGKKRAQHSS